MTFNDKRYLLCSIARKYAGRRYEIDELINEAWLDKNVQAQTDVKRFSMAGNWAMLTYMRKQEKKLRKKWHIFTHPLIIDDGYVVEPVVTSFNTVDSIDELDWMTRTLTAREKLIVDLRLKGLNWTEIAQRIGVSKERICQIRNEVFEIMRTRCVA